MPVDISIIICSSRDSLLKTLESIERLSLDDGMTCELLVIDNGLPDAARGSVLEFIQKDEKRKYHREPSKGASCARNCGVRNASGRILAFADDDVIVDPQWLRFLRKTFDENPGALAVQGKILLQKNIDTLPPWVDPDDLSFCPYYNPGETVDSCDILIGANMALRSEAFEKYGFFDERLGPGASGFGEDTEFARRLIQAGEKVLYQPKAVVYHEYREDRFTWDYWLKRIEDHAHSRAVSDVLIYKRRISRTGNLFKLWRYHLKYLLSVLSGDKRKRWKYDRKIRTLRWYAHWLKEIERLRRQADREQSR